MESDDDSRSSNSSGSSNSSSNGPASPPQNDNENESNDQPEQIGVQHHDERSGSLSQDSNSFQGRQDDSNQGNKSPSPVHEKSNEQEQSKDGQDEEEELELSDMDDEESNKNNKKDISHEDLSDISDLESSNGPPSPEYTDLRQKLQNKRQNGSTNEIDMKNDEDELDFEDDEVKESSESVKKQPQQQQQQQAPQESKDSGNGSVKEDGEHKSDREIESGEELEDGEVTDGDEKRPEESEPKAVCRFFTRGQCTWGMSCRFLHPGTTDKGNYTMFDLVRPIPVPQANMGMMPSYDYRTERPIHHPPHIPPHFGGSARPPIPPTNDNESAWERGLRTAKEMMRKANKRKEQDMDFDEKKMNLSGPPDEVERDPYYVRESPDDTPPFEKLPRGPPMRGGQPFSPPAKFARTAAYFEEDQYGRMPRYRELPPHRMPHYEDEEIGKRRPNRPTREVIVEKASDDWNDPWMRKKSPGRGGNSKGRKGRERSYSSNSSYSSSSSSSRSRSRSHSSSDSSPTPSHRRRFDSKNSRERITPRKVERKSRSTSLKRRHSPVRARVTKKAISPVAIPKRAKKQASPINKAVSGQRKKRDSSSSSGGSESDSSYSSSTSSSKGKKRREKLASERKPAGKKVEMTKKRASPPPQPAAKEDDKPAEKPSEKASAAAKLKSSRREELLKQLKAVEDAIARKRSKIT